MTTKELDQLGFIFENNRIEEITYRDYLNEYWADETTTPRGVDSRLFVDQIDWADDDREYRTIYQVRTWGPGGSGPHKLVAEYETKDEADIHIYESWERRYQTLSADSPIFYASEEDLIQGVASSFNRSVKVIERWLHMKEYLATDANRIARETEKMRQFKREEIELEAAELTPDALLLDDLMASDDLKGEERSKARAAAQISFLHRVGHFPVRTDFWRVFKIVNKKAPIMQ